MQRIKGISAYRRSLHDIIIDAAMEAFSKDGIKAVKMDDVAQHLSISKRTIYELFFNKETLLLEVLKKHKADKERELEEMSRQCNNVIEMMLKAYYQKINIFKNTNPQFYSDLKKYPSVVELFKQDSESVHEKYHEFLKRGISEGVFRSDINIELTTRLLDTVTFSMMADELYKTYNIEDIFKSLAFISIRGICTRKGLDLLDEGII